MALDKEQLRKFHGVQDLPGPADPSVLSRKAKHEAAAEFVVEWSTRLQVFFILVGLLFILLPAMFETWRAVVIEVPVVVRIYQDYSTISGLAMSNFLVNCLIVTVKATMVKHTPGGHVVGLTYRDIITMELYPKTRKQEFAYWVDIAAALAATTTWLFLPFGVLAYFIATGG